MKIQGSIALVTGANRGLGRAFVEALVAAGASKIYAAAREPSSIGTPGVEPIRLDITNEAEVRRAAQQCGDVTLLINNAAVLEPEPFLSEAGAQAARSQLETNFFGTLALSQAFAPVLARHGGGALVNLLSVLSWLNIPQAGTYGASKAAAWALTNGLRNELRAQGTLVVGVHAAYIDTDMARHIQTPKTAPEAVVRQVLDAVEAGCEEVLVDEVTRNVKRGLVAERPIYLGEAR